MFDDPLGLGMGSGPKKRPKRGPVAKSQKNEVLARQKNKCANCGNNLDPRSTHFDHIREVYKGGKSKVSNLQALCANCHNIKTHRDRLKRTEKNRSTKRKKPSLFGGDPLSGRAQTRRKPKDPFDFRL